MADDREETARRMAVSRPLAFVAVILAAGYVLFSAVYSYRAPYGWWYNHIFGGRVWGEHDPGAFYVAAAHQLAWGKTPLFVGHPGSTLLLLLLAVQRLYYALASPDGLSFTQFTARNLPTVFFLSKLLMTALHLLSFIAIYAFAKRLLRDERAAVFAALGYATSLPVLYYLSRISVEPLMVTFFVLSFLAVWRYQDLAAAGRTRPALGRAGLAAAAAVSGAITKLNFLGPLPFFLALCLVADARPWGAAEPIPWRTRGLALGVFGLVGIALALLYSQIIDWHSFFSVWTYFEPQADWSWKRLLPALTPEGAFVLTEIAFIAIATTGWLCFLFRNDEPRSQALWVSVYAAFALVVWVYRVVLLGNLLPFHYFFLPELVLAVFFGHFTALLLRRFPALSSGRRMAVFGLVWLGSIHGAAAWAVVGSRQHDVESYAPFRAVLTLVSQLSPSERLGVETRGGAFGEKLRGLHSMPFENSDIRRAFEGLFVQSNPGADGPGVRRLFVPALGSHVVVVKPSR